MENELPPPPQTPPSAPPPAPSSVTPSPPQPPLPEISSQLPPPPQLEVPAPPPLEISSTRSDGRVLGALSLLIGTFLVLVVLLSGIGWLGWRLYRIEQRSAASRVASTGSDAPNPSSTPPTAAAEAPVDHPPAAATTVPDRPPDSAAAEDASTTPHTGATNTVVELTGFSPQQAATGEIVTLTGHGLSKADQVVLIPMDASSFCAAATIKHTDTEVTFAVPEMDGAMSPHFAVGIFNDDGASLLLDQSVPTTALGGVVPTSKGAMRVSPGDSINAQDHLLIVAEEGSRVAVGDDCFVILEKDAKLCVFGKDCHVYSNFDRQVLGAGEIRGNTNLPSVRVTLVPHDLEYRGSQ